MLILRRTPGQAIRISDLIEVRILRAGPHNVKLGVTAPPEISVYRSEIYRSVSESEQHYLLGGMMPAKENVVYPRIRS